MHEEPYARRFSGSPPQPPPSRRPRRRSRARTGPRLRRSPRRGWPAPGQEALDLDRSALAALRSAEGEVRIAGFPIAPGALATIAVERFEVTTPDARITVSGPDGEKSLPFPSIAHFAGKIEGEPGLVRLPRGAARQALRLRLRSRRRDGLRRAGPGPQADFVARTGDSPLNEQPLEPWACATEELPAALTAIAEPSSRRRRRPSPG